MNGVKIIKEILSNSKLDETRKFMILYGFWGNLIYRCREPDKTSAEDILVLSRLFAFYNFMKYIGRFDGRVNIKHWESLCPFINQGVSGIMDAKLELLPFERNDEITGVQAAYNKFYEVGEELLAKKIVPYDVYNSWFQMGAL